MLIKIAKNGIESEWFQLTKKRHRTLLLEKPDAVFVHILPILTGTAYLRLRRSVLQIGLQ